MNSSLGICNGTSKNNFTCTCPRSWEGCQCEIKVNFCLNHTCQNRGVCRPQIGFATCECLSGTSGKFCEITEKKIVILRFVSKSLCDTTI